VCIFSHVRSSTLNQVVSILSQVSQDRQCDSVVISVALAGITLKIISDALGKGI